jgi:hypothetical protein
MAAREHLFSQRHGAFYAFGVYCQPHYCFFVSWMGCVERYKIVMECVWGARRDFATFHGTR